MDKTTSLIIAKICLQNKFHQALEITQKNVKVILEKDKAEIKELTDTRRRLIENIGESYTESMNADIGGLDVFNPKNFDVSFPITNLPIQINQKICIYL